MAYEVIQQPVLGEIIEAKQEVVVETNKEESEGGGRNPSQLSVMSGGFDQSWSWSSADCCFELDLASRWWHSTKVESVLRLSVFRSVHLNVPFSEKNGYDVGNFANWIVTNAGD